MARAVPAMVMAVAAVAAGCTGAEPRTNLAPLIRAPFAVTDEDTPITINVLDGATDAEGDTLTVLDPKAAGHTTKLIAGTSILVTPAHDFNGMLIVTYVVSDGTNMVSGRATVMVKPVNDPPTTTGYALNVHGKATVMLSGIDIDGDTLAFDIVQGPSHGTLMGMGPSYEYRPVVGFVGDDAVRFVVRDRSTASQPATVELHVLPGSPPVAIDGIASGNEDRAIPFQLSASDPDGDPFAYTIVSAPLHGALSGAPPNVTYTPVRDFNGTDTLTFAVNDGFGPSNIATVTITVRPVNDAPVAIAQAAATSEETSKEIPLTGSDVEGDSLTFQVGTPPQHGTVQIIGAVATYAPAVDFHGTDSFTFLASDGLLLSAPATVTIDVANTEDPPVALPLSPAVNEDSSVGVTLAGSDVDGDTLTFAVVAGPLHGALSGSPPALTYTPEHDYNGPDSFTFTASDGTITSPAATVSIDVRAVNDAPVATDATVPTDEDTPVTFTLHGTDVDSTSLTFSVVGIPSDGTLTGTPPTLTYTPAKDKNGTRTFRFRVTDDRGASGDGTVTFAIAPTNDNPTTADDYAATDPGTPLTFAVVNNDSDIDGDTVTLDSIDAPDHGDVEIVEGKIRYTPDAGFTGVETVTYTATDSHGGSATGTAHVGVGTFPIGAPAEAIATIAGPINIDDASRAPAISSDGRYVAFTSSVALIPEDTNGAEDVFVYDRGTRTLERVSVASDGAQSNGASFRPHLSGNGRYVVFDSAASNLVAGDTNGKQDVFRRDRVTGQTIRVSVTSGGAQASGDSSDPEISDDGNVIVFQSLAFDLIASDANTASDVFVRDLIAGTTVRVSVTSAGGEADLGSTEPAISGDGRFIVFTSPSINLVPGDGNNASDIFLRDRIAGTTIRASVSSTGGEANTACSHPSISQNGRFVSFRSAATNLVGSPPPRANVLQVFVRDLEEHTMTMAAQPVLTTANNVVWPRLSGDGRFVTTYSGPSSGGGMFVRDRFAGPAATFGASHWPMPSASGRYIVALDPSGGGRVVVLPNPLIPNPL